ncbi:unnamed protein product, partial [Sphenostylis stenocarpa]
DRPVDGLGSEAGGQFLPATAPPFFCQGGNEGSHEDDSHEPTPEVLEGLQEEIVRVAPAPLAHAVEDKEVRKGNFTLTFFPPVDSPSQQFVADMEGGGKCGALQ